MIARKALFIVFFLQVFYLQLFANSDSLKNIFVKVSPGYGVIIRHREAMGNLMQHVSNFTIEIGKQPYGKKLWEQLYHYPEFGGGYYFANLHNPQILGYVHAFYAFLNSPIIRKSKFTVNYQIALGVSYLTQHFDYRKNYTNLAIGSHFNAYFNLQFNALFRLSKNMELQAGVGACHYSNGAFKQPNLGINVARFDMGLKYYLNGYFDKKQVLELPFLKKTNEFVVLFSGGLKTIPPIGGPRYLMGTFSFYYSRPISFKRKLGLGTDIFYDETLYAESVNEEEIPLKSVVKNGIYFSHEYLIDKLTIAIQLGAYTYYKYKPFFPLYTRLALRYNVSERFLINASLKAHLGVADFIEWGIGYRIKWMK